MTVLFKEGKAKAFDGSVELPENDEQQQQWQKANRRWWEKNPMRYDFTTGLEVEEFSREFYDQIDQRFFAAVAEMMPWTEIPFDNLIDFKRLADKDVLEIGVGNGSHAQLLASHAGSYTGIDLTEYAVRSTSRRMVHRRIDGAEIVRVDAEKMAFADESFDFIWSWGVIHHSSDTASILREMHRVLRPGGRASVMIYHRSFWIYWIMAGLFKGVLLGDLFKTRSIDVTLQRWTDGAIARYYTVPDWVELVSDRFEVEKALVVGQKAELFPLPAGRFKNAVMNAVPDRLTRFVTNSLRQGRFIYTDLVKRS